MISLSSRMAARKTRKRAILAVIAGSLVVALALVFITGNGRAVFPFLYGTMEAENRDIGQGVTVSGDQIPSDIQAQLAPDNIALSPDLAAINFGDFLTPIVDITPSGSLRAQARLTFTTTQPVSGEDVAFVLTSPNGQPGTWQVLEAEIMPDQMHVTVQTSHFSYYQAYTPRAQQTAQRLTQQVNERVNNELAVPNPTVGVNRPSCQQSEAVLNDGHTIDSSNKDTVLWCAGLNAAGTRELKVVNNRSYPLELLADGMTITSNGGNDYDLSALASLGVDIVMPGRTALVEIGQLAEGSNANTRTQLSDAAVGLKIAQVIGEILVGFLTGGASTQTANADKLLKAAFKVADCIEGLSERNFAAYLVRCFKDVIFQEVFGKNPAKIFGVVELATRTVEASRAVFNAVGDQANGRGEYRIVVSRSAAASLADFEGAWERNTSVMRFDSQGSGTRTLAIGNDCDGFGPCLFNTELKLELLGAGRARATHVSVSYTNGAGEAIPTPFTFEEDLPRQGDTMIIELDRFDRLTTTYEGRFADTNDLDGDGQLDNVNYFCGDETPVEQLSPCAI